MAKNRAQIQCIKKQDRQNPWERITHVGGVSTGPWQITQEKAIEFIETGLWDFWVKPANGDSVWVEVAVSRFGNKYIKTSADGDHPNNLLSLPECP